MDLSIVKSIHEIRGMRVMLDFDLAKRYEVETRALKQSVRRNIERFPDDFMFQLTKDEWRELVTNCDKFNKNIKHSPITPLAFTQEGVAMLSGVLHSKKAIDANIDIMRAFVAIRQYIMEYAELKHELYDFMRETNIRFEKNDTRLDNNDVKVGEVFNMLKELFEQKKSFENRKRIGFNADKI
ncbi:MAG: ORF6N domain-containing protein [Bacteroidales bacterium]|nr:ORF6N domain-containing protein [Bacteroidales bacterium]